MEKVESDKQELFLDKENCILVDGDDKKIGVSSKRDCHKVDVNDQIKLHRAFSVFLFNKKGEMLLQKRSNHKVN
jgi:isopentenyl-diphosphate delta-isomerase